MRSVIISNVDNLISILQLSRKKLEKDSQHLRDKMIESPDLVFEKEK